MRNVYDLMEIAEGELKERLPDPYYTDDWQWNNNGCFQFTLMRGLETVGTYRFYPQDEEWYGLIEDQIEAWIKENFDFLEV